MTAIYVQFSDCGQHIRKWAREPFEGGAPYDHPAPIDPPEAMWGGLARQIMMWLDFGTKTPRVLFKHLERTGCEIPQWLRDEPEMKHLDHVPSKGTRCVIIYRAMLEASTHPTEIEGMSL